MLQRDAIRLIKEGREAARPVLSCNDESSIYIRTVTADHVPMRRHGDIRDEDWNSVEDQHADIELPYPLLRLRKAGADASLGFGIVQLDFAGPTLRVPSEEAVARVVEGN